MKNRRFGLALTAMLPVFALIPACMSEVGEEGDVAAEDGAAFAEVSRLDTESSTDPGPCPSYCTKKTFVGAGDCHPWCWPVSDCGYGMKKYACIHQNYDHAKNCASNDIYLKTSAWNVTTNCQSSPPVSGDCPGFCN